MTMTISPSPFTGIIETQKYPHARTQRTSFFQKLLDCFNVVAGAVPFFLGSRTRHAGIFDYLTFGIPLLLLKLYADTNSPFLSLPLGIISFLLIIPRAVFGGVVTVLFSPLIAAVHGISLLLTNKKTHTDALQVRGKRWLVENDTYDTTDISKGLTLGEYMQQRGISGGVEALDVRLCKTGDKAFELRFIQGRYEDDRSDDEIVQDAFTVPINTTKKGYLTDADDTQNNNLHALFTLNMAGAVKAIEEYKDDTEKEALLLRVNPHM